MIWSRLSHQTPIQILCQTHIESPCHVHLLILQLSSLQMTDYPSLKVVFPGEKYLPLLSYLQKLDALIHSDS